MNWNFLMFCLVNKNNDTRKSTTILIIDAIAFSVWNQNPSIICFSFQGHPSLIQGYFHNIFAFSFWIKTPQSLSISVRWSSIPITGLDGTMASCVSIFNCVFQSETMKWVLLEYNELSTPLLTEHSVCAQLAMVISISQEEF